MKNLETMFGAVTGSLRAALFVLMIFTLIPFLLVYKRFRHADLFSGTRLFHAALLKILSIRVHVIGAPATFAPVLYVANHTSYLDIPVLGSILRAAFVAKADVAAWPFFGFLSKVQDTVFIERRSTRASETLIQLQEQLFEGRSLILFPEGTSSVGVEVLPFKSSLFRMFEGDRSGPKITIQPISLICTHFDGSPISLAQRPLYAWYGDMTLPPHLWNVFKNGRFIVEVTFHEPFLAPEDANRKELAATCQQVVARGIEQSLKARALV